MRHRFDIWHVHWLYPTGWMAHDVLTRVGVPIVMTAHGADLQVNMETSYGFRQFARHDRRVRELVPRVKVLTAISASIDSCYRELGATPSRIFRIPNGVDVERIEKAPLTRQAVRERLGIDQRTALILSIGRNQPSKGFQFVPAVLAKLNSEGRNVCWIIVGKDSAELWPAMQAAGVASHVRLLPPICAREGSLNFPPDELAELYAAADVFAFPSLSESFGLVSLEAMAAATPVVANDVPGIRDVVANEIDGLLCPPCNPDAMATAIGRVLDDASLAERLATAGLRKAKAHDWNVIATQYLDLYRSVLNGAFE